MHSLPQIEYYKSIVDDFSIKVSGGKHITTLDKHKIYLYIRGSLPYMPLRPCTNKEWKTLNHVILTSDKDWDPTCFDCEGQLDNE